MLHRESVLGRFALQEMVSLLRRVEMLQSDILISLKRRCFPTVVHLLKSSRGCIFSMTFFIILLQISQSLVNLKFPLLRPDYCSRISLVFKAKSEFLPGTKEWKCDNHNLNSTGTKSKQNDSRLVL